MSPLDWAIRPLRKYAQFSGRAPRAEYWWFYLGYIILAVVLEILTRISSFFGILAIAYLALVIPMLAVGVRRLHDINKTGWWLLAPIIPYAIGVAMLFPAMMTGMMGGVDEDPLTNPGLMASAGAAGIFMLIGFVLAIVIFVFSLLPGTKGPNRYGPDPYDPHNVEEVFA